MRAQEHIWLDRLAWSIEEASQLAEFAIALPLLIFFVVGIFDFSGAFTLKQKLTNIARDTARAAAADPTTDLSNPATGQQNGLPYSVNDAFYVFDNYLLANNIDDCGIKPPTTNGQTLTWQSTVNSGSSPCGITFTINRGYYFPFLVATKSALPTVLCTPPATGAGATQVVATCVSIQYSYQWRFGQIASLLGRNAVLPTSISAVAVAMNEN